MTRFNILSLTAIIAFSQTALGQFNWTNEAISVPSSSNAILGTANSKPLIFKTNNQSRVTIDQEGNLSVAALSNTAGINDKLVVVDANGNFKTVGNANSTPCINSAMPWYEGGNTLYFANRNTAGTCNQIDFILKSNNENLVFLTTSKKVGIGPYNSSPSEVLDISDGVNYGNSFEHTTISGSQNGIIQTSSAMNLSYNGSNGTNSFFINEGSFGTNSLPKFCITAGNVGIGTLYNSLAAKFTVDATNQLNTTGMSLIVNSSVLNAIDLTNKTTNKVEFRVKSNGFVYAREINVLPTNLNFPDYVFQKNYKLLSLLELRDFVEKNSHLPNIAPASEINRAGINVAEMQIKQMEKIEEAYLYIFELKNEIEQLKEKVKELESKN